MSHPPASLQTRLSVRDLSVAASVGANSSEMGKSQPLVVDIDLIVTTPAQDELLHTVDYCAVTEMAKELGVRKHIVLIETYARELALSCLAMDRVERVEVSVRKPHALAGAIAGTTVIANRSPIDIEEFHSGGQNY